MGLVVALTGAWEVTRPVTRWVVESVPGGGLVRDGQKWLAPWLVLLAVASALGARRVARAAARRWHDAALRRVVLVAVLLLPLVTLPDLAWGALGRLASVDYPDDWTRAREVLAADPAPGDVVSLPWSTFRRFEWNLGRTVLDPAAARDAAHRGHRHLPRRTPRTASSSWCPGTTRARRGSGRRCAPGPTSGRCCGRRGSAGPSSCPASARRRCPQGPSLVVDGADLDLYRLAPAGGRSAAQRGGAVAAGLAAAGMVLVLAAASAARSRRSGHESDTPSSEDSAAGATGW